MTPADEFDGCLYRAVERRYVDDILTAGIPADRLTYWGIHPVAAYYAETIVDDGDEPAILCASLEDFEETFLRADLPGIAEPLSHLLNTNDEAVYRAWQGVDGGWRSSLNLIGSISYEGSLPATAIRLADQDAGTQNSNDGYLV